MLLNHVSGKPEVPQRKLGNPYSFEAASGIDWLWIGCAATEVMRGYMLLNKKLLRFFALYIDLSEPGNCIEYWPAECPHPAWGPRMGKG